MNDNDISTSFSEDVENIDMGPFSKLGEKILGKILLYLQDTDLLTLSLVCKAFYVYSNDEQMWKVLFFFWEKTKIVFTSLIFERESA